MNIESLIERTVSVFNQSENEWLDGVIVGVNDDRGIHVQFFHGDDEWIKDFTEGVRVDGLSEEDLKAIYFGVSGNTLGFDETEELKVIPTTVASWHKTMKNIVVRESDLPMNGALLIGSVYSATDLISQNMYEGDGQVFYRVLFAEGSSKQSYFKCKVPIYTSTMCNNLTNPSWDDEPFRFEIAHTENKTLPKNADITVVVYKSRDNGGNEMVGQVSFTLASLVETGTNEFTLPNTTTKVLEGDFPLLARDGTLLSDESVLAFRFQLIWRGSTNIAPQVPQLPLTKDMSTKAPRPKSAGRVSIAGDSKLGSQLSSQRPNSALRSRSGATVGKDKDAASRAAGSKAAASSAPILLAKLIKDVQPTIKQEPARKIVSAGDRKKREDQMRIERENALMMSRLQKSGSKKAKDEASVAASAYALDAIKPSEKGNDNTSKRVGKPLSSYSSAELQDILARTKQELLAIESENLNLKGMINKHKQQFKRFGSAVERIQKISSNENAEMDDKVTDEKRETDDKTDKKEAFITDMNELLRSFNLDVSRIMDKELFDLAEEHIVLQTIRRQLSKKIDANKHSMVEAHQSSQEAMSREQVLVRRLQLWYPRHPFLETLASSIPVNEEEKYLMQQIETNKSELNSIKALAEEGLYTAELENSVVELESVVKFLNSVKEKTMKKIEEIRYSRDHCKERLAEILDIEGNLEVRDNIAIIKNTIAELKRVKSFENLQKAILESQKVLLDLPVKREDRANRTDLFD